MKPILRGPYRKRSWCRELWYSAWTEIVLGVIIAVLVIVLGLHIFKTYVFHQNHSRNLPTWITSEHLWQLHEYHGSKTPIRVTDNEVQIERDGKWIVVERRKDGTQTNRPR
ncbi:MAG: hypothetical protein ACWGQW_00880 [bacterium]